MWGSVLKQLRLTASTCSATADVQSGPPRTCSAGATAAACRALSLPQSLQRLTDSNAEQRHAKLKLLPECMPWQLLHSSWQVRLCLQALPACHMPEWTPHESSADTARSGSLCRCQTGSKSPTGLAFLPAVSQKYWLSPSISSPWTYRSSDSCRLRLPRTSKLT